MIHPGSQKIKHEKPLRPIVEESAWIWSSASLEPTLPGAISGRYFVLRKSRRNLWQILQKRFDYALEIRTYKPDQTNLVSPAHVKCQLSSSGGFFV